MTEAAPSYFATVPLPRVEREQRTITAKQEEIAVLRWFQQHPDRLATAEEVHDALCPHWTLGSTRRAVTNLKNLDALEKTDVLRMGGLGHKARCYRLARPSQPRQEKLF